MKFICQLLIYRALYSLLQLNSNDQSNNSDILLTLDPCDEKKMINMKNLTNEITKLFKGIKDSGWILEQKGNLKFNIEP